MLINIHSTAAQHITNMTKIKVKLVPNGIHNHKSVLISTDSISSSYVKNTQTALGTTSAVAHIVKSSTIQKKMESLNPGDFNNI